jgi:hypothetical protein
MIKYGTIDMRDAMPECPCCKWVSSVTRQEENLFYCSSCDLWFNSAGQVSRRIVIDDPTMCVMCGREGGRVRDDGRVYCSHCWSVWSS